MKKWLKNIIIFVLILVIALGAYLVLRKPEVPALAPTPTSTTAGEGETRPETAIGREFLSMLSSLKGISLDDSILKDKTFAALKDFSTPIERTPELEGRPNPFAPPEQAVEKSLVETEQATLIGTDQATLNGFIDLSLSQAAKRFSWGETPDLSNRTSAVTEATSTGFFSQTISGLAPNTTYYYRAEALSGTQLTSGEVVTFTTSAE